MTIQDNMKKPINLFILNANQLSKSFKYKMNHSLTTYENYKYNLPAKF